MKIDRTYWSVGAFEDAEKDEAKALSKMTPQQKSAIITFLRESYYGRQATTGRVQRVFKSFRIPLESDKAGAHMNANKRKKLEAAGWKVGGTKEFLELTTSEMEYVELKLALAKNLAETRKAKKMTQIELAHRLKSSQSRVAKMEAGDASVSIDLLVRSLFELRVPRKSIEKALRISAPGTKKSA